MIQCCASCGRPLPGTNRFGIAFARGYAKIIDVLLSAGDKGVRADDLFDQVYDAGDGGPLSGLNSMYVRIHYVNRRLKLKNKRIVNKQPKRGPDSFGHYYLIDL